MSKWEFYDEDDEVELTESDSEPSFSFYDFKKWLSGQKNKPQESIRESVVNTNKNSKEELKNIFKKRIHDKVQKKVDDKLAAKRKKK